MFLPTNPTHPPTELCVYVCRWEGGGEGATYCFSDGSRWRRRRRKTSCPHCDNSGFLTFSVISLFCLKQISCPLCNSNTLRNILMVLGRNVEQDEMLCCVQERQQLCLSYLWRYVLLLYLTVIMH